ncbi:MAG: PBP1A family penicillin-binding protein [Oscillospiraceae bacterium]|jgi:1A family penicillin-binding protein|nr:PBP1A family penicillin-binding protein [Oscillospiraceae bacterium]
MKKPDAQKEKKPRRWRRVLGYTALGIFVAALGLGVWGYFALDVAHWQRIDPAKITNLQQTTLIYDNAGAFVTAVQAVEDRTVVSLERVPLHVRNAFLAAEDLRFYQHPGVDIVRIFGALINDLRTRSYREGASTITQQLIKLSHLTEEKALSRKLQEAYLALQLERDYSKDEILAMYLNFINFGNGAYGIQAAARAYFGVDVDALSLTQGAALAAAIKAPSLYAPHTHPEENRTRRNYILNTMLQQGMITQAQADEAKAATLTATAREPKPIPYGWFVDETLDEAAALLSLSAEDVLGSGHRIYTTLNTRLQDIADKLYTDKGRFPANARDGVPAQSAFALLDVQTGALRALVGGRSYTVRRGLNRATDMRRSPGSAIKPLAVYGPALDLGYGTASVLLDEYGDFNGYRPKNAGNIYYGRVTMRTALTNSLNVPAVRLLREIGIPASRAYLEKAGIPLDDRDQNLSIALGSLTIGVTPAEMAASYAIFANGGTYRPPYVIDRIVDSAGNTVYTHQAQSRQVTSPQNAFLMTSMLQSVASYGTASRLRATGQDIAAKTGTVSLTEGGNRDVWVAAYTPELVATVWMGFDQTDNAHKVPSGSTGGNLPAALATAFFQAAYKDLPKPTFTQPKGMVWLDIDKQSIRDRGVPMLASERTPKSYRYSELFLESNRPMRVSDVWQPPRAPSSFYIAHGDSGKPILIFEPVDTARYRIQRDSVGESIILAEVDGGAGAVQRYTDESARFGISYTYRVIPVHAELLAEGILLEGPQAIQVTQARWPQGQGLLEDVRHFFAAEEETEPQQAETSLFQ